jgi:hypothetical protein
LALVVAAEQAFGSPTALPILVVSWPHVKSKSCIPLGSMRILRLHDFLVRILCTLGEELLTRVFCSEAGFTRRATGFGTWITTVSKVDAAMVEADIVGQISI